MRESKIILVSAANSTYFNLYKGQWQSITDQINDGDEECDHKYGQIQFGLFDCGLDDYEVEWAKKNGIIVVKPERFSLEDYLESKIPPSHIGYMERPFIPNHFPDYDIYIWIDADAWVQCIDALDAYVWCAERNKIGIVPEIDRSIIYNHAHYDVNVNFAYYNYKKYYSEEVAQRFVAPKWPMINNGVFSINGKSPLWNQWQSSFLYALVNNHSKPEFGIDQISLNYAIYSGNQEIHQLPLTYNWMVTHCKPCIKTIAEGCSFLVEPLFPFAEIKIIHLLDNTKWNRQGIKVLDHGGNEISHDSLILNYNTLRVL